MPAIAIEPNISSQPKTNGEIHHPEIFAHHRTRILGMYGMSMLVMLMAGSQYGFSAYGPSIKTKLDFYQSDIELVSTLGNIGTYLGPLTGILVNLFSPFITLTIGAIACLLGYGSMGLIIMSSNHTFRTPGWLGSAFFVAGFGSGLMYATCLAVNVHNIPPHRRGLSVAILVSLFGLSATVFTGIFNGWGSDRVAEFLITAAFMISSVGMVAAITVKRIDFSVVHHSIPSDVVDSSYLRSSDDSSESTPINEHIHSDHEDTLTSTSTSTTTISSHVRAAEDPTLHPIRRVWLSLLALIRDTTFWMLFVTFVLVAGAGLMQINNMGELVKSLNGGIEDHTFTLTCITIFSLGNCGGRLIMAISDYTRLRRAWFLAGTSALMMLGHILQAYVFITKTSVIGSSVLLGLAYGGLWSILPIIVSEAFGITNFAINFGWLGVAPGIASAIFNSIAGALYQHQITTDAKNCIGSACYRNAFIFASVASGVAMIVAIILVPRTQPGKKSIKPQTE